MKRGSWRPRLVAVATAVLTTIVATHAGALGRGKAVYMGGTLSAIPDKTEGLIDLKNEAMLTFTPPRNARIEIPWAAISEIEYGQKAGRRIVQAVFLSPFSLFAKNRKHYVTLSWTDSDGKAQAAVLQFDKNDIRAAMAILRTRTGKDITFQDEEAQKQMGGGVPAEKE